MTRRLNLDEARTLVGETMHVDPEWWAWTPGEIRWLAGQWRLAHTVPAAPVAVPWRVEVWAGAVWVFTGSPRILRVMTAFAVLFCYGFGWGWICA